VSEWKGALGLDLGTTRIKLAGLDGHGALGAVRSLAAPEPAGSGAIREVDPERYRALADELLAPAPQGVALGIASQRSSFVLWERASGRPVTPLVSWQDRRAAAWCESHRESARLAREITGLVLSPHYAGPKLATMLADEPDLARRMRSGEVAFGTLETYLLWHWTQGASHATDLSMAARTMLADPVSATWADDLLELFGVPREALPAIEPTSGRAVPLPGLPGGRRLSASLADQAAGALATLGETRGAALVNLGTGVFVLRPTGSERRLAAGYLSGPLAGDGARALFALEGTVNGGGTTADRFASGPTALPANDPAPEAFCLPDENGVGAPHWRALQPFALSSAAQRLAPSEQRRVVLEGLLFRVSEILADLGDDFGAPARVRVTGGLAREPFVAEGLAACLARPIELVEESESTLLGAARLAAGLDPFARLSSRAVEPPAHGAWLRAKYPRWRAWLGQLLSASPSAG